MFTSWKNLLAALLVHASLMADEVPQFRDLFNGRDLTDWVNVNTADLTWSVREGLLVCKGQPIGALVQRSNMKTSCCTSNGVSRASVKKGYLCLESEGAEIHFRNIKILELPPGITTIEETASEVKYLEEASACFYVVARNTIYTSPAGREAECFSLALN